MSVKDLNDRSIEIFRTLVDTFVETGEPVGSRTLSRKLDNSLSPATIRNIMADLEDLGLLYAPHTSAGRLPTPEGLNYFIHGLLEIGDLSDEDKNKIAQRFSEKKMGIEDVLSEASRLLSGLSQCASLVIAPKSSLRIKHIEFVSLSNNKALAVMVNDNGFIENRIISVPKTITAHELTQASNYINHTWQYFTLEDITKGIAKMRKNKQQDLDKLTQKVIENGIAAWNNTQTKETLIIKGQHNLLRNVQDMQDLEKIQQLFNEMDEQTNLENLLQESIKAEGVQIFIGAENSLFSLSGCSMIASPYKDGNKKIIGSIGVIGPMRINYRRIIPLVDYTSKVVSKLLSER